MTKALSLYGLKFHPFRPDVPHDALFTTPAVDSFLRRVELGIADGGFAMLTGDPGTGKSIALRLLAERLRALPDVLVGTVEHPQSRTMDFYRELGDLFGVPLASHNRWAGFKALRARWADHIASTRCRPVLIIEFGGGTHGEAVRVGGITRPPVRPALVRVRLAGSTDLRHRPGERDDRCRCHERLHSRLSRRGSLAWRQLVERRDLSGGPCDYASGPPAEQRDEGAEHHRAERGDEALE